MAEMPEDVVPKAAGAGAGAGGDAERGRKPQFASGYPAEMLELVRRSCLYVTTILGDLVEEEVVIVGGLVPALIIPQDGMQSSEERHIGTRDLDLGFALSVLDQERYAAIAERLRDAGFEPDTNNHRNQTRQRWRIRTPGELPVAVDFLIPPLKDGPRPGKPFPLEPDFAATVIPGLELGFRDRVLVTLEGRTIRSEWARRTVSVCGPGAFIVLKARALRGRGEPKDAYDLYYVLRHYGASVQDVADRLRPLLDNEVAREALAWLAEDFGRVDAIGPRRLAAFLQAENDDALQADARAFVLELLDRCGVTVPA